MKPFAPMLAAKAPVEKWRGIHKLTEEAGELLRILGKLGAFPVGEHPSGEDLRAELENELADLEAAISYFRLVNKVFGKSYNERRESKYRRFIAWKLTGVKP